MGHFGPSRVVLGPFWDSLCFLGPLRYPSPAFAILAHVRAHFGTPKSGFFGSRLGYFLTFRICFSTISDIILEAAVGSDQPKKRIKMGPGGLAEDPKIQKAAFAKTLFPYFLGSRSLPSKPYPKSSKASKRAIQKWTRTIQFFR